MLEKMTRLYPVQKTLRFELKPVGETADYIDDFKSDYLKQVVIKDQKRAVLFLEAKKIIDDYHRQFINNCLKDASKYLDINDLENAFSSYERYIQDRDKINKNKLENILNKLQKKTSKSFDGYKKLLSKDIFPIVKKWLEEEKREGEIQVIESFNKFSTYFSGYFSNRENIYTANGNKTELSYRIIYENLPIFFKNIQNYKKNILNKVDLSIEKEKLRYFEDLSSFTSVLTQEGIEAYQGVIGQVNSLLNEFRQKNNLKKRELPNFSSLHKIILSETTSNPYFDQIENTQDAFIKIQRIINITDNIAHILSSLIKNSDSFDFRGIYIGNNKLSHLSNELFGNHAVIKNALYSLAEKTFPVPEGKKLTKKIIDERIKFIDHNYFSIENLNHCIKDYFYNLKQEDGDYEFASQYKNKEINIWKYFINGLDKQKTLEADFKSLKKYLENKASQDSPEILGKDDKEIIKKGLDYIQSFHRLFFPLEPYHKGKRFELTSEDTDFYDAFEEKYLELKNNCVQVYNQVRNYLTKKPYSLEKIKINFENPQFLNGWDANKEKDYLSTIFTKDNLYYLGIIHPEHKKILNDISSTVDSKENYKKMVYKLLPGPNKMLPKVFFADSNINFYNPSSQILRIRNHSSHTKHGNPQNGYEKHDFNLEDCHTMIDFYKKSLLMHPEWSRFNFSFSDTAKYSDMKLFYEDIESQGYNISFENVASENIGQFVKEGKILLFQIYNKDFSPYSKGSPNLHTLYWKALFQEENLRDIVVKLNGGAELFFRKHSISKKNRTIHRANEKIKRKTSKNKESLFAYDIIKDKRFTKDKFFFHVPLTLNFKEKKRENINNRVNELISQEKAPCIIGIDRGERHLLYYSVINSEGKIIEQGSFNFIKHGVDAEGKEISKNYHALLSEKEKERESARKEWQNINQIKDLKAGYLSQVVHKLAQLIIKYNAIVCLEDLNSSFKRQRVNVEKQVYQNFEKALINKLNYLVFKNANFLEVGHYLNAFQLTAPFESFEKIGKQSGVLYYVNPSYTSGVDPLTGFINLMPFSSLNTIEKMKSFVQKLERFYYDKKSDYLVVEFDYQKIRPDFKLGEYKNKWEVCFHGGSRDINTKVNGHWTSNVINLDERIRNLLKENNIDYKDGHNLLEKISEVKKGSFFRDFIYYFKILLSFRYSIVNSETDYILSPTKNEKDTFFDSRKIDEKLPSNADANGAYHIALKGLMLVERIKLATKEGTKPNLMIKNEDWFTFLLRNHL